MGNSQLLEQYPLSGRDDGRMRRNAKPGEATLHKQYTLPGKLPTISNSSLGNSNSVGALQSIRTAGD